MLLHGLCLIAVSGWCSLVEVFGPPLLQNTEHRLSRCGTWLRCPKACGILPDPTSPALADGFLTTGPPGNYQGFIQAASVMSNSSATLRTSSLPGSSVWGILQARILEWAAISSSTGLPDPGIEPVSSALQVDSLLLNHQGSPLRFSYEY